LTVIVPTYNERENISELIEKIEHVLRNIEYEIIVVDDNSLDGTADMVETLNARYGNILILRRLSKLGLISAILAGIEVSRGSFVAVMDADLQHPPELLPRMLKEVMSGVDITIASRYSLGGRIERWDILSRIVSRGAIWYAHLLLPQTRRVKDPVSGYFMFKKEILNGIRFEGSGFKFLIELLAKAPGARISEVPCLFKPRKMGKSKRCLVEYYRYMLLCLKLAGYRPLKFVLVGTSGIVVNMVIFHLLVTLGIPIHLASPLAIEASILNNFTWNDMWTFRGERGRRVVRCLNFHGATLMGALINYLALLALIRTGLTHLTANLIGIFLGFTTNYLLSELYVWKAKAEERKNI
jgi:dolichol-phosphate mannosyltransferase